MKLCDLLNIPYTPGPRNKVKPIYVKNLETGEEKEYKSGYAALKDLGVTVVIYQYPKLQTPMKMGGVKFMISR